MLWRQHLSPAGLVSAAATSFPALPQRRAKWMSGGVIGSREDMLPPPPPPPTATADASGSGSGSGSGSATATAAARL